MEVPRPTDVGRQAADRRKYHMFLVRAWAYTVIWITMCGAVLLYWDSVGWGVRILVGTIMGAFAPDLRTLRCSYGRYVQRTSSQRLKSF